MQACCAAPARCPRPRRAIGNCARSTQRCRASQRERRALRAFIMDRLSDEPSQTWRTHLCPDHHIGARREHRERLLQTRNQRQQCWKLVRICVQDDYGYRQRRKILLILEILVDGHEGVEVLRRQRQQFAVLDTTPAPLDHGLHIVVRQGPAKATLNRLVKQQAHRRKIVLERPQELLLRFREEQMESPPRSPRERNSPPSSRKGSEQAL